MGRRRNDRSTAMTATGSLFVAGLLIGCAASPSQDQDNGGSGNGLNGVWQTEGYGHVVEVDDRNARFYEVSAVSCIPSWKLEVRPPRREDAGGLFALPSDGLNIDVQPGEHADERWLRIESLASRRRIRRIDALPSACSAASASDALAVFDVFAQTYDEHYPFFDLKGVDWPEVRARERAKISSETTSETLFQILKGMIEPLEDAHTFISAGDLQTGYGGRRSDPNPLDDDARSRVVEIIQRDYLLDSLRMACNDQIGTGRLAGNVRYLVLGSFSGYGEDFGTGLVCLEEALDRWLEDPEDIAGAIVDVRINDGGADPYGLEIASRLATAEYLAYTKQTRNDPDDATSWSDGQASMVRPSARTSFPGSVILLTGLRSVSAAETFTMALMGRKPPIVRIGQNTQGVFSDVLSRSLPNGWSFGLPNERFLTADGRSFDGPGVPPDIETPIFTRDDLDAGVDSAIDKALEILGRTQN